MVQVKSVRAGVAHIAATRRRTSVHVHRTAPGLGARSQLRRRQLYETEYAGSGDASEAAERDKSLDRVVEQRQKTGQVGRLCQPVIFPFIWCGQQ
jgi:hypothetical protein